MRRKINIEAASKKTERIFVAALGPYEFLKEFQREWKYEDTPLHDVEKWSHAMGYSIPAGSKPFETSLAAGNIALAVMGLERVMKGEDHSWKTPEQQPAGIKYHNDAIRENMIEALDDLYEFKGMRSEEANKAWINDPRMRRPQYRRIRLPKVAREILAGLTDEKAVDLVRKKEQLLYKLQSHMDNIVDGLQNADDQIEGLQKGGGGIIDASVILRKNVANKVEALRNFCNVVLKQLE